MLHFERNGEMYKLLITFRDTFYQPLFDYRIKIFDDYEIICMCV